MLIYLSKNIINLNASRVSIFKVKFCFRLKVSFTFWQGPIHSQLYMSWSYSGQGTILVPPSSLYYPTYVANSPLNVTVGCLPYLTEVTDTSNKSSDCVNY